MYWLFLKYLKFCKKHNIEDVWLPKKYDFLDGYFLLDNMELTDDVYTFKEMLKRIYQNDGYCPCALKKIPETECPCVACRKANNCHCGLYETVVPNENKK